jgi:hypothetical protein
MIAYERDRYNLAVLGATPSFYLIGKIGKKIIVGVHVWRLKVGIYDEVLS